MLTGGRTAPEEDDDRLRVQDPMARQLLEHDDLRWVVVDDLVGDRCELAISPWPRVNDSGMLTFAATEDEYEVAAVHAGWLADLVVAARREQAPDAAGGPDPAVGRPLRVGDAFAARIHVAADSDGPLTHDEPGARIVSGRHGLADLSGDARVYAKVQSAVADAAPTPAAALPDLREDAPAGSVGA